MMPMGRRLQVKIMSSAGWRVPEADVLGASARRTLLRSVSRRLRFVAPPRAVTRAKVLNYLISSQKSGTERPMTAAFMKLERPMAYLEY